MTSKAEPIIPISVLTGFLGSGKTTVLNHLMQEPKLKRTLVLINEFGKIGLDHHLIVPSDDDAVIEMSSGCLCCTFRADLVKTLRDAPARFARGGERWFDRVVIETTGIADPAPILHTLMNNADITRRYRLDGVIATVDAVNGEETLNHHLECVKQVAVADRLLLTKTDLAESHQLGALQARLRQLNPSAPLLAAEHGKVDPARLFSGGLYDPGNMHSEVQSWLDAEADWQLPVQGAETNPVSRHDARIRASSFVVDGPITRQTLEAWQQSLIQFDAAKLLRIKGIVRIAASDRPIVIHGVQHTFHPHIELDDWPSEDQHSRIVFITYDIDESELQATLTTLTNDRAEFRHKVGQRLLQTG